jgi:hypothetical protein
MLALTLTAKETIVIDTPEGVVRVTLRPRPEWFLVAARPGQRGGSRKQQGGGDEDGDGRLPGR